MREEGDTTNLEHFNLPFRFRQTDPIQINSNYELAPRSDVLRHPTLTEVKQAPSWLLNAYQALEFLTSEHPKVMSTLSTILITVGSIPSIPAVGAGAGGAILASTTAHAVGAIAVGVGSALRTVNGVQPGRDPK